MNRPKRSKQRRQLQLESLEQRRLLAVDGIFIDLSRGGSIDLFNPTPGTLQGGFVSNGLGITIGTANVPGQNNQPPVAADDSLQFGENASSLDITSQLLANDSDVDARDTLTIIAAGSATSGSVSLTSGLLTYDPNGQFESLTAGETATDTFTYTIDDGHNAEATATVTVTVSGVNDAPTFTAGADQAVNEDAGPQSVSGWATAIHDGDAGSAQTLTFNILSNSNTELFSVTPTIDAAGALSYKTLQDANGSAIITYNLQDEGGTANGGADTSATQSFTINVTPVNDPPSFSLNTTAETINENEGPQTHSGFATVLSTGPINEGGQTVSFAVTNNSNPSLFSSGPKIDPAGNISFTTANEADGVAILKIAAVDDGGTVAGGVNTSTEQTFTLTVGEINVAPVLLPIGDKSVNEETTLSFTATATDIDLPANDLTFSLEGAPTGASITSEGAFSWTPTEEQGPDSYTFTVVVTDNGSPSLTDSETITVTVAEANKSPTVPSQSYAATGNVPIQVGANAGLLVGVGDVDIPQNTLSLSSVDATSANGGTITSVDLATGAFTYVSAPGFEGTDTFEFTVTDGSATVTQTTTVTVSDTIWFVNSAVAPGGDGTMLSPFDSFTPLNDDGNDLDDPGDVIYVATGAAIYNVTHGDTTVHDHGFVLEDDQIVIGQGAQGATLAGWLSGQTAVEIAALSATLPPIGGTNPHITNTSGDVFTAASGNLITGVTLDPVASAGIAGEGVEDLVVEFVIIITSGGTNNNEGINLRTVKGTLTFRNIDIGSEDGGTNAGPAIQIDGGTAELMFDDVDIDQSGGTLLNIINTFSSTLNFDDRSQLKLRNSNQSAVTIVGNDGGTVILNNNGLDIETQATVVFNVVDNRGLSARTPVNDAPSFRVPRQAPEVLEDSGPQVVSGFASHISPGPDPNEADQTVTFTVLADPGLFAVQPAIDASGNLTYTPADNAFGTAQITVQLQDDGGTDKGGVDRSDVETFSIVIKPVNDPPKFALGPNPAAIPEDAPPQTINGFAHSLHAGPPNEVGQALSFDILDNTNPGLFAAGSTINSDGDLTYTPAPNANGVATITVSLRDDGGKDEGGIDRSLPQTFDITIAPAVNDPPMFDVPASVGTDLHASSQTISGFVSNIQPGPADEAGQSVSLAIVGNDNASIFATQPAIDNNGTLTFAPAANGTAMIAVQATDNGGTDFGGNDTSPIRSFTINISEGNVAPVLSTVGNRTVGETQILAFPVTVADLNGDTLQFDLANEPTGATITDDGDFSWTPTEAQGPGNFTFDIIVSDGEFTDKETIQVTVNELNSAPVLNDVGNKTITAGQLLSFEASASDTDNPSNDLTYTLSDNAPTGALITPAGAFTWTPTANQANNDFTFDVIVTDNGAGTLSDHETITVTVNAPPALPPIANVIFDVAQATLSGSTHYFSYIAIDAVDSDVNAQSHLERIFPGESAFTRTALSNGRHEFHGSYGTLPELIAAHNGTHTFRFDYDGDGTHEDEFTIDLDLSDVTTATFPAFPTVHGPSGTITDTTPLISWNAMPGAASSYISVNRAKGPGFDDDVEVFYTDLSGTVTSIETSELPTGVDLTGGVQINFLRDGYTTTSSNDGSVDIDFFVNSITATSFNITPPADIATIEMELGRYNDGTGSWSHEFLIDLEVHDSRANSATKLFFEAPDEVGFQQMNGGPFSGWVDVSQESNETDAEFFVLFGDDWRFRIDFAGDGFNASQGDEEITVELNLTNVANAFTDAPQLTGPAATGTVSTANGTPKITWLPLDTNEVDFIIATAVEVGGDDLLDEDLENSATSVDLTGASAGTPVDVAIAAVVTDSSRGTVSNESPPVDFTFWIANNATSEIDIHGADIAEVTFDIVEAHLGGPPVYFSSLKLNILEGDVSNPLAVWYKGPSDATFQPLRQGPAPDSLPHHGILQLDIEPAGSDGSLASLLSWIDGTHEFRFDFGDDGSFEHELELQLDTSGLGTADFLGVPTITAPTSDQTLPINQREATIAWTEPAGTNFTQVYVQAADDSEATMFEADVVAGIGSVTTSLLPAGVPFSSPVITFAEQDVVTTNDPLDGKLLFGTGLITAFSIDEVTKSVSPTDDAGFFGGGPYAVGGVSFDFDGLAGPGTAKFEYQTTRHTDQWWYVVGGDTPGQRLFMDFNITGNGRSQAWLVEVEDASDNPVDFDHVDLTLHYDPTLFDASSGGVDIETRLGAYQYDASIGKWNELPLLAQHLEDDTITVRASRNNAYIVLGFDYDAPNFAPYFPNDWIGHTHIEVIKVHGAADQPFFIGNIDVSAMGPNLRQESRIAIKVPGSTTFELHDGGENDYGYAFIEDQFASFADLVAARHGTYEVQVDFENDGTFDETFAFTVDLSGVTEADLPDLPTIHAPSATTTVTAGQPVSLSWDLQTDTDGSAAFVHIANGPGVADNEQVFAAELSEPTSDIAINVLPVDKELMAGVGANETHHDRISGTSSAGVVHTELEFTNINTVFFGGSALRAADGQAENVNATALTQEQLAPIVDAAILRLESVGKFCALGSVAFRIADLPDGILGLSTPSTVTIDLDAAGHGWFIDPTPSEDSEFQPGGLFANLSNNTDGPAGRIDLLTVVMHELGHTLGLGHSEAVDDLMHESLNTGERRLPSETFPDDLLDLLAEDVGSL